MGSVRFYAVRLDPRWLALAGVLIAAVIVAMLSLRGADRGHSAPVDPPPPTVGVSIPPTEPLFDGALSARPAEPAGAPGDHPR